MHDSYFEYSLHIFEVDPGSDYLILCMRHT